MVELTKLLSANNDMRTVGDTKEVVELVLRGPYSVDDIINHIRTGDTYIRARAMDALQKITVKKPESVLKYKTDLLTWIAEINQQEVQWHVAQILPQFRLTDSEHKQALGIYRRYLQSPSSIVKTWALDALVKLAQVDPSYQAEANDQLQKTLTSGSPAMQARAKNLMSTFKLL